VDLALYKEACEHDSGDRWAWKERGGQRKGCSSLAVWLVGAANLPTNIVVD